MENNLKLYVWEDVLCDYTCGAIIALAHNVKEARQILLKNEEITKEDIDKRPKIYKKPYTLAVWGGS